MTKHKNIQPSVFWTNLADRLRFSLPFDFYASIDVEQAVATLRKYQSRQRRFRRCTLETDTQPEIAEFCLTMFLQPREIPLAWAVGQIQPVENMERVQIQGKIYPNVYAAVLGTIGIVLSAGLSLILFLQWSTDNPTIVNFFVLLTPLLSVLTVSAIVRGEVFGARNRLLKKIRRLFRL